MRHRCAFNFSCEKGASLPVTPDKWDGSQEIRTPSSIYELLGISMGARAEVAAGPATSTLTVRFEKPAGGSARHRKMTLEEFAAGWTGGKVGRERCGPDVGAERVEGPGCGRA